MSVPDVMGSRLSLDGVPRASARRGAAAIRQAPERTLDLPRVSPERVSRTPRGRADDERMLDAAAPPVVGLPCSRRRVVVGVAFCVLSLLACVLVARRLTTASWPLEHARLAF